MAGDLLSKCEKASVRQHFGFKPSANMEHDNTNEGKGVGYFIEMFGGVQPVALSSSSNNSILSKGHTG